MSPWDVRGCIAGASPACRRRGTSVSQRGLFWGTVVDRGDARPPLGTRIVVQPEHIDTGPLGDVKQVLLLEARWGSNFACPGTRTCREPIPPLTNRKPRNW